MVIIIGLIVACLEALSRKVAKVITGSHVGSERERNTQTEITNTKDQMRV